ncbi:hypothetical protein [Frigidibacter oleivorans]|uniref:hypothetical protein n=1 Tax=Frigidibacter oleivorans TaxID=2487129 RepID=UPI000F8EB6FE|nr:hypothetical protein [Frigidibacter oleivorans]
MAMIGRASVWRGLVRTGLVLVAGALPAAAQDEVQPRLTFNVTERLESTENLGLDPDSLGRTDQSLTSMSLRWHSATPTSELIFDLGGLVRIDDGPEADDTVNGLTDPRLFFSYSREAATAALSVTGRYRRIPITSLLPDPDDPLGVEDERGTGLREDAELGARIDWGIGTPVGFGLEANLRDVDYSDDDGANDPYRRETVSARLRHAFDHATEGRVTLRYSHYKAEDEDARETPGLDVELDRQRPDGLWTGVLGFDDPPEGLRTRLEFGRDRDLPAGRIGFRIGATHSEAADKTMLTGRFDWRRDMPLGRVDFGLNRSVRSGEDDEETLLTGLRAGLSREIGPLSALSLNLSYVVSEEQGGDDETTRDGTLSAAYRRTLAQTWDLSLGYRHRMRDEEGEDTARSDSVFLTLERSFVLLP